MLEFSASNVFDVKADVLQTFVTTQMKKQQCVRDMIMTNNSAVLLKFCDVCRQLNIDPMHAQALPVVIVFMCKSKHCKDIAQVYLAECGMSEVLDNMSLFDVQQESICDQMLSSMGDWLALFSYLELREYDSSSALCLKLAREIEHNKMLRRMQISLQEAQVVPMGTLPQQRISMQQTALLAFLYMTPRKTPAGKMLEMLYTDINSAVKDAELRCLRAMTAFKDTMDDEDAYAETLPLVLLSMTVRVDFGKGVEAVLRKQQTNEEGFRQQSSHSTMRPLLRMYAQKSALKNRSLTDCTSWTNWRQMLNFPATTSSSMQMLLYFISVQKETPRRELYEKFYTKEMCDKAAGCTVESIDASAINMVVSSLRVYQYRIKTLIDFSSQCLQGINQKKRQALSVVQILQLYIASFQHPSIWEKCWKHVVPTMNHTIIDNVNKFVQKNTLDVDVVLQNLLHSQIFDL